MELWIKSQDGLFCGVVKKIELSPYKSGTIVCDKSDIILGKYETVERCREIIDEISIRLKKAFYYQMNINIKPERVEAIIREAVEKRDKGIILGNAFELVQVNTDFYEMPKD